MGISQFFVSRPIFAWVIAIVIMMADRIDHAPSGRAIP
jgi:multidrug efflux pump subunit AcrB